MEAVAKYREAEDRYREALPLRKQVVTGRRKQLGPEHQLTLAAEARLAVTYIELKRPDRAKPLLVHVHHGLAAAPGVDEATVLAVTERLADVELSLQHYEDADVLLREVISRTGSGVTRWPAKPSVSNWAPRLFGRAATPRRPTCCAPWSKSGVGPRYR